MSAKFCRAQCLVPQHFEVASQRGCAILLRKRSAFCSAHACKWYQVQSRYVPLEWKGESVMTNDSIHAQAKTPPSQPNPALKDFEGLVGDWEMEISNASFLP